MPSPTFGAKSVAVDAVAMAIREAWAVADRTVRPQVVNATLRRILGEKLADRALAPALGLLKMQPDPPNGDGEPAGVLELCVRCRKVKLREQRRPYRGKVRMELLRDRRWMERQCEQLGKRDQEIADLIGCQKQSVAVWRCRHGIEPGKFHQPWMHESTMRRLIIDKGLAPGEVARELGCEVHTVRSWASRLGIATGKRGWAHHEYRWWAERVASGWTQCQMAQAVGIQPHAVLWHLRKWGLHTDRTPYERARLRKPKHKRLYEPGWLARQLKRERSYEEIAREVGCVATTVVYAARKLGLRNGRPPRPTPWTKDPEWYRARFKRRMTAAEMAAEVCIKEKSIFNYMGALSVLHEYHDTVERSEVRC